MANTYTLIASNTLTSSAASVTFSSIPNTYTDLEVRISARCDGAEIAEENEMYFNSATGASYSWRYVMNVNGTATSNGYSSSGGAGLLRVYGTGGGATSNTFGNSSVYIPNYAGNTNKPISFANHSENNGTRADGGAWAGLFISTAVISSITIKARSGLNFVSGSSFFLYGIKNS